MTVANDADAAVEQTPERHPFRAPDADEVRPSVGADRRRWDGTWLVRWHEVGVLFAALLCVVAVGSLVGLTITDWTAPNAITDADERVANTFVDGRTDALTSIVPWAAGISDTYVKIGISALICTLCVVKWRRWDEAVYIALPLVFEATAFVTITHIVLRPRPDVDRLLESSINSSFPSGHVAASTVYAAVAVVVLHHTRNMFVRAVVVGVIPAIVLAVSWGRLYQGMHFLSDVVAGILLGIVSLLITDRVLRAAAHRHTPSRPFMSRSTPGFGSERDVDVWGRARSELSGTTCPRW